MSIVLAIAAAILAVFGLTVFRGAPYVPSRKKDVAKVFGDVYELGPDDTLIDIGSGDGRICMAAYQYGAEAIGYEINPFLVLISMWRARKMPGVSFRWRDFWHVQAPQSTTIVYTFGDGRDIERMATWVETQATRLGRPLYFLSYGFTLQSRKAVKRNQMYFLYRIQPLQPDKA